MKFATCFPEEEVIKLQRLKHFEEGLEEQTKARGEGIEGVATQPREEPLYVVNLFYLEGRG